MSASLAAQQRAFLDALFAAGHDDAVARLVRSTSVEPTPGWQRGLLAYRSTAHALAERALCAAYPVVAQLLGDANFAALARELWRTAPPQRGDVAQWGDQLPALIEGIAELREQEPYLADVARVEWLRHRAATAADASADIASLALLTQTDPARVRLVLAPASAQVASPWPVASLVLAHLEGEPGLAAAAELLRARTPETAVIWRDGLKPCVRVALPGEPELLAALQDRRSLADSLAGAPGLDFAAWLSLAVHTGLVLRAEPL